ncbi:response regulator [Oxalobacteraceae bacterium R-40]|uniref:Response regulator n=1 Tax=Keguizhuia sedimenti TaxID=3064264 RepID=A0ABU1BLB1_9BURK|nr:response regulator [Oxalobacteraceae bacterium R-40]
MIKEQVEVCTTQKAAEILGMSVSSVQKLVETGEIEAWKTKGGHRRIPLSSVLSYKASTGSGKLAGEEQPLPSRLLVVEDDLLMRELYDVQFKSWGLSMEVTFCSSGYRALIEIGSDPPDILLLDIMMNGIDGYEVMETVMAKPQLRHINILVISGIQPSELDARGGIPPGVTFFAKPAPIEELRGYLRACCAFKQRMAL